MGDGEYFYKYRAVDNNNVDRTRRIFTHSELYFPSANQFNDPFDSQFDFSFDANLKDTKQYLRTVMKRESPNLNRQQREAWIRSHIGILKGDEKSDFYRGLQVRTRDTLSNIGIFSLSRKPDDILMWSHYADSHSGYCLKFYDDELEWFIARAQPVVYSGEYPVLNPIKDDEKTRLDKTLLTKALHWEYEDEWRIIDYEEGPGIKHFPPHLLEGVIFGCKMPEEDRSRIRDWCSERAHKVKFLEAQQSARSYALNIVEID